jgi:hypothetical protein
LNNYHNDPKATTIPSIHPRDVLNRPAPDNHSI